MFIDVDNNLLLPTILPSILLLILSILINITSIFTLIFFGIRFFLMEKLNYNNNKIFFTFTITFK
ncbi:hypothetical protein DERP_009794 [Dermatophagoides pteronyssinus]|uniref:Uncharacterized protein n=1 Tax=Dermatophagoides pteronyssinus TaxID=6956 RepID=A0ABQ8IRK1_DERPT|nr:hypothetical protein DERP_009794 [Dermatophagoides pteronyssinus]